MAPAIDRTNPDQAMAILRGLVPDEEARDNVLRTLASLAEAAATRNPASWSITLRPAAIQLNVGMILLFRVGRRGLGFAGRAQASLPERAQALVEHTGPFAAMAGVVFRSLPLAAVHEAAVVDVLTAESEIIAREASGARGPWRRAHSPGVVVLLEHKLGRALAWEAPTAGQDPAPSLSTVIARVQAQPAARLERRRQAIEAARGKIAEKLGKLTEADLRELFALFNCDLVDGRVMANRFATGFVGNNANLLVGRLGAVNQAVQKLWGADDRWIVEQLGSMRRGGSLPGGGWLFPTMILHTREPERFLPLTEAMAEGLAALDGGLKISLRNGQGYLDYCARTRALLTTHHISPHFADILLWYGQQQEEDDDDSASVEAAPTTAAAVAPSSVATQYSPSQVTSALNHTPVAPPEGKTGRATATVVESAPTIHTTSSAVAPPVFPTPAADISRVMGGGATESKTPVAVPQRGSVGWLHLTDLHQGMHSSRWLWPNVLSSVFDDLGRLHDSCGPWDLVLFTGDLTQRGSAEEFKELDRTLERLWRRFEQLGSCPKLIAVPGNHDLKRPDHWYDPIPLALSQWHRHRELRDRVLDASDNPYILELRRCFAPYTEWCARSPWFARENVRQGLLPGDIAVSCSIGGLDVGVIGLNSTFLQLTGEDFFERLDIHPRQLQVCGDYASEWLQQHHINLLLTHHPPEWLEGRARQEFRHEIDPGGRFAAHFYGHMHEGASTSTSHGGSHLRHTIQGASLFGLEEYDGPGGKVSRIHGYSAGRFEPLEATGPLEKVRVRVHPRRMIAGAGGRRIAPDFSQGELDARNSFSFEVQAMKRS